MSDDKTKRAPQDSSLVSMTEAYEVDYWTQRFGVSRERLEEAVEKVGNSVAAIGAYLSR